MKKKLLIGLGTLSGVVTVGVVALVIYFWPYIQAIDPSIITWSNIRSLYMGMTQDQKQLDEKMKAGDDKFSEEIKKHISINIRDFTEEEKKLIESGEKTKIELVAEIISEASGTGKKTETTPPVNTAGDKNQTGQEDGNQSGENSGEKTEKPPVTTPDSGANSGKKAETADEIVARHISKLYEYHGDFEGRLAALESTVRNYMHAYKSANPNITWHDAKVATLQKFTSSATAIETDCYAKVDGEIEALRKDLKAIGADLSVVQVVKDAAYNEMEIRKAKVVNEANAKMNKND